VSYLNFVVLRNEKQAMVRSAFSGLVSLPHAFHHPGPVARASF